MALLLMETGLNSFPYPFRQGCQAWAVLRPTFESIVSGFCYLCLKSAGVGENGMGALLHKFSAKYC